MNAVLSVDVTDVTIDLTTAELLLPIESVYQTLTTMLCNEVTLGLKLHCSMFRRSAMMTCMYYKCQKSYTSITILGTNITWQ